MDPETGESFQMDLESAERYLHHDMRMQSEKAKTANRVAVVLVVGIVGSLPLYLLAIWLNAEALDRFTSGFEKWLTVVSTLAGTAIGAYYGAQMGRNNREAKYARRR